MDSRRLLTLISGLTAGGLAAYAVKLLCDTIDGQQREIEWLRKTAIEHHTRLHDTLLRNNILVDENAKLRGVEAHFAKTPYDRPQQVIQAVVCGVVDRDDLEEIERVICDQRLEEKKENV